MTMKAMRSRLGWIATILGAILAGHLHAVEAGQSRQEVIAALGHPNGEVGTAARTILYYDRGTVVLCDGVVQQLELTSDEAMERRAEARRESREAEQARAEAACEARRLRGQAVMDRKLADPVLREADPQDRIRYWRDFAATYPEVDVSVVMAAAVDDYEEQILRSEKRPRLAALEDRVAAAEARARRAEVRVDRDRYGYGRYDDWQASLVRFPRYASYVRVPRSRGRAVLCEPSGIDASRGLSPGERVPLTATEPDPLPVFFAADLVR